MKKYQINTSSNSENIVEDSTRKTTRKTRIEGSYDSALFIGSVFISTLQNKTSGIYQLAMFYVEDTAFSNPLLTSTAKKFVISEVEEKQLFDTLFLPKDRETETYHFQWTISDGGEIIDTYTMPTVFTIRVSENESIISVDESTLKKSKADVIVEKAPEKPVVKKISAEDKEEEEYTKRQSKSNTNNFVKTSRQKRKLYGSFFHNNGIKSSTKPNCFCGNH